MIEQRVKISPCYVLPRGSQFQHIEPITTRKPKFSSESKITSYERLIDHDTTLLCPAQGFPVPTYSLLENLTIIEPVATKKPKFSSDAKFAGYDRVVDQDLTLFCPAQGFPVPTYRRVMSIIFRRFVIIIRSLGNITIVEPVTPKKPKLSSDFKMAWYDRIVDQDLTLFCPVKGFPVPIYRTSGNEETQVFERH
ncbi:hypothetical protein M0802_004239 [Mischocyttarus mexicanus]|nr:hypothetical protein M0802_004239 [Mischocyttarus mexicanus]